MKMRRFALSVAAACVASTVSAQAALISSNFNSDSFSGKYNLFGNGGAVPNFAWSATGGVLDQPSSIAGGGIVATPNVDQTATYKAAQFKLTDGSLATISMFIKYAGGGASGDKPLQLGFTNMAADGLNSNTNVQFLSARLLANNTAEFQYRDAATVTTNNTAFAANIFKSNDWVKLTFSAQQTAANVFNWSFQVDDYGATGTAAPVVLLPAVSGTLTNASLGTAMASTYAAFRTTISENPGFDNLSINATLVPEPASLTLLSLGALGLLARRR